MVTFTFESVFSSIRAAEKLSLAFDSLGLGRQELEF